MKAALFLAPGILVLLVFIGIPALTSDPEDPAPRPEPTNPPDPSPTGDPVADLSARRLHFAVTDRGGFSRMRKPRRGEWLAEHDEPGQTFDEYTASRPVKAGKDRNVLAFLPIGPFAEHERKVAESTVTFSGLWYGLPTRLMNAIELPGADFQRERQNPWTGGPMTQYHTDAFLRRILPRRLPDDAVMLAGVTMGDLYPGAGWNYVFGMATFRQRVGVYSLVRYFPAFQGNENTEDARRQALLRSLKLVTHEIGHCFGLAHCIDFRCGMNGSNSLREADSRPIHFCPVCLRKLQWNRGFDVLARFRALNEFYRREGLKADATWTDRRIRAIESVR